jgi:predicted RNA methylase
MTSFTWRCESDDPVPETWLDVDDGLRADVAVRRARAGEYLRYTGDFQNAKQLVQAMGRRLPAGRRQPKSALEAFRAERKARLLEHQTLSRVLVTLDAKYQLALARAPDVSLACRQAWGDSQGKDTLVPLKTLLGMMGAAEWRKKGLSVPGLQGPLEPHYGVFVPTRHEYVDLLKALPDVAGKQVWDIGTGTGVLSFLLLQHGAAAAVATDIDERAVACAQANAEKLKLAARFSVSKRDGFPEGQADIIICNPPWVPEPAKNRVDRAVFDEDSAFLRSFLSGLKAHLKPGGYGLLLLSDLAVLLGLREASWLDEQVAAAGLKVSWKKSVPARHSKAKQRDDVLFVTRAKELTTLYRLEPL